MDEQRQLARGKLLCVAMVIVGSLLIEVGIRALMTGAAKLGGLCVPGIALVAAGFLLFFRRRRSDR